MDILQLKILCANSKSWCNKHLCILMISGIKEYIINLIKYNKIKTLTFCIQFTNV